VIRTAQQSPDTEERTSMSNINKAFANGKAIIPFITCGDPDLETTAKVIRELAANGADMIELGIPFSDPTAEGPAAQEAAIRALKGGATTDKIFDMIREVRKDVTIPMTIMTYPNVVFSYGTEKFISICAQLAIDGIMLPDVPYEEKEDFLPTCKKYGVELISVVSHTSGSRVQMIASEAEGYLHITTDGKADIAPTANEAKKYTSIKCAAELAEPTEDQVKKAFETVDGIIITIGIIRIMEKHGKSAAPFAGEYIKKIKAAV